MSSQKKSEDRDLYWKEHFKRWEETDLSERKYCIKENIPRGSFRYYRKKILGYKKTSASLFVPIKITPSQKEPKTESHRSINNSYIFECPGGFRLKIPEKCDPALLFKILSALGYQSC